MSPRLDQPLTPVQLVRQFLLPALFVGGLFAAYLFGHPGVDEEVARPVDDGASGDVPADTTRPYVELTGKALGTGYTIKVVGDLPPEQRQTARDAVVAQLADVDAAMSTWREDSELSRFNAQASTEPVALSAATMEVLRAADLVHRRSGGAFDVTVGPLVQRWGFGSQGRTPTEPDVDELAALRQVVGQGKLSLGEESATKAVPGLQVDLSAIAKGYAVDRVYLALAGLGHADLMVEIGGEVRVGGTNPAGQAWRIGIEAPDADSRSAESTRALRDQALATSGDYRNFYERGGVRRSHTIDPRTGRPITHDLASVTVVAPDCMTADAWATALNVLGPVNGPALADAQGLQAYFLVREGDGLRSVASEAWAAATADGQDPPAAQ